LNKEREEKLTVSGKQFHMAPQKFDARTHGRSGDFILCPMLCIALALDRQKWNHHQRCCCWSFSPRLLIDCYFCKITDRACCIQTIPSTQMCVWRGMTWTNAF